METEKSNAPFSRIHDEGGDISAEVGELKARLSKLESDLAALIAELKTRRAPRTFESAP